jgi:hypothetical protein
MSALMLHISINSILRLHLTRITAIELVRTFYASDPEHHQR